MPDRANTGKAVPVNVDLLIVAGAFCIVHAMSIYALSRHSARQFNRLMDRIDRLSDFHAADVARDAYLDSRPVPEQETVILKEESLRGV